jgi:flagellar biosynthesis protein FlhG
LVFDENKEKFQGPVPSDEAREKVKTLPETSSSDPAEPGQKLPESLASKPATAPSPPAEPEPTACGGLPQKSAEQSGPAPVINPQSPLEQAKPLASKPATAPSPPAEPVPIAAEKSVSAPAFGPKTPVEQAKPASPATSSTDSLMKKILPAGKSKTIPDVAAVKKGSKKIIAVGGAKGGVGKSMLSANLAVGLALLGQKVVLADLDLGGADVHLYTGVKSLAKTWNDFLDKKVNSIQDILTPTAFKGLSLIGGDSSRLGSANLAYSQKLKMMRHLKEELETDFLIVDLGGDTTYNGLDFFLLADQKIVVSGTEPASVLDSYTFVKVVFNRLLERFCSEHKPLKDLADKIKDGSLEASKNYSLDFIYQEVRSRDQQAFYELKKQLDQFRLSIVLNMTESSKDMRIAETMQKLVKDKCFLDIGILGTIPFDKGVRQAARGFTPIVVESPKCQASRNIHQMLAAIILHHEQDATRAELLQSTSRIRREAKQQIDAGNMTLDGLTVEQINTVFANAPRLRQSFRKILNIMTG